MSNRVIATSPVLLLAALLTVAVCSFAAAPPRATVSALSRDYQKLEALPPQAVVASYDFGYDHDRQGETLSPYVKCPVRPLLDVPLRDASICRGPDGVYYLTGTLGQQRGAASSAPDFQNTLQIHLWKSANGIAWTALGAVWDIGDYKSYTPHPQNTPNRWMQYHRLNPEQPDAGPARGITSPEIHYLKGTFWIPFALNENGCGLLKSVSGKAEGPYENVARFDGSEEGGVILSAGGTPSLFADDDGTVYFVWGEGWIAKLKDDLTGLAEKPRLLMVEAGGGPGGAPQRCGRRGAFLTKEKGKYTLIAEDINPRLGNAPCRDTFIATAENIYGPYSPRELLIPHGGQACIFRDDKGRLFASMSGHGGDPYARCQDRPTILPLVQDNFLGRIGRRMWVVTEAGLVSTLKPCWDVSVNEPVGISHPLVTLEPDGYYYVTGSNERDTNGVPAIRLWRSQDLKRWERVEPPGSNDGFVWNCANGDEWAAKPSPSRAVPQQPHHDLWGAQLFRHNGTYWMPYYMFNRDAMNLLRSTTGKPEGPYEQTAFKWNDGSPHLFRFGDAVWMMFCFGPPRIGKMKDDLTGFATAPREITYVNACRQGLESGWISQIAGKYVFFHGRHSGYSSLQSGGKPIYRQDTTWDATYSVADDIMGPYSEPRLAVPHGGTGSVFRDKQGRYWASLFGEDSTAPFNSRLGFVPLEVKAENGTVTIRVADEFPADMDMSKNHFPQQSE